MANEAEIPFTPPAPGSAADRYFRDIIQKAVEETAIELARTFTTEESVRAITKREIPRSLRDVDHQTVGGIYAQLGPGGTMIYGGAPGSGSGDSLPEGGTLYQVLQRDADTNPVWDWVRAHA